MNQTALFPDPDQPCTRCNGKGTVGPPHDTRTCRSCGGTGRAKDQPNPETDPIPF